MMNPGQKMFYEFFMSRVASNNRDEAKTLLDKSFARQDAGTFTRDYFDAIEPVLLGLVKKESLEEVKEAMATFKSRLGG